MCKAHVQLKKEHGGKEKVLVRPESGVVHDTYTACIVTNIHGKPDLLNRQPCPLRKTMPFCCQGLEDVVHNGFTEENHAKPAKTWNEAQFVWFCLIETSGGVTHAEAFIAAKNEGLAGF